MIMVGSFDMSSFKLLNAFSIYRNVNRYGIPILFNSSKEYKTYVSSLSYDLFYNYTSLLHFINNELILSKYNLKPSFSISYFVFTFHFQIIWMELLLKLFLLIHLSLNMHLNKYLKDFLYIL